MNLRNKLIFQYVRQLFGFLLVLLLFLIIAMLGLGWRIMNEQLSIDLSRLDASDLTLKIDYEGERIHVEPEIEKSVARHQGWLQIIDKHGKILYNYRTPADVPSQFGPGEWIAYVENRDASRYHITNWVINQSDENIIILYGTPAPEKEMMKRLIAAKTGKSKETWDELNESFSQEKAWYLVYDRAGKLIHQWNHPNASAQLDMTEVLQNGETAKNVPVHITSRYDKNSDLTYVVGIPNPTYQSGVQETSEDAMVKETFLQIGIVLILVVLFAGSWYAWRVGKPLLHMVNWLERLAQGRYEEPIGKKGKPIGRNWRGKEKKSFRVFKDVFDALRHLSETLRSNEKLQREIEQTREEWITGLSHDLKTPLSSIYGYATFLESDQYEWDRKEVSEFGKTIREKSDYMNGLIEDLNLTYRLKNQALPMVKQPVAIVETIRRIVVDMVNDPSSSLHDIEFSANVQSITAEVDPIWFRRIIVNILTNAIKYTPTGTHVLVEVQSIAADQFMVKIADDGPGMDETTLANLFERYYRGGHTGENTSGTGLGMAIAKQLVLAHGGEITVDSKLGSGTVVVMTFPAVTS
ncbi:sensor histidine kinase [Brevibacillus porteri]|uniref:histidine kinase n=1 Tax=Brevibacillus porteri TaxID=2126350 RepID=A0ABX5FSW3_9BACL|nr:HAMP domain-containing sensor histidine kinase [Brevibacillus porteri]MED1797256.1 HAMP domain-containing sensor histidine kinase [Brevibacillus porteri]MED2129326.1 HAMP domain-containing sensor histidine kinase [Brevibacillus porteri]MED2743025.1 HAMP domain-containing sensor histidine kinase [Brevibacillus porteri]MED2817822.1 HAMP domain-containing sensor histidine kinase [Brevibacillus porteri]MED2896880.1 HAMP domain-containing sensor histidine kinase [Brevibacillus porteri]